MSQIMKTILAGFDDLPRVLLRKLILCKLAEGAVVMPDEAVEGLIDHILSRAEGDFVWDGPDGLDDVSLTFTEEDEAELERMIGAIGPSVTSVVNEVIEGFSKDLFADLWSKWPLERALQEADVQGFQERLEERWGEGLDYLRMLLTCCREVGGETYKRHNRSKAKRFAYRRWVLVRLHSRACQIADEIICLMENGFADGALARWRTLHELSVVAALIADGDEDLAERYINHDAVEVKKQADEYEAVQVPLGFGPLARRSRRQIEKRYDAAIARYGQTFSHPFGWAAHHLGMKKPTFKDLQEAADRTEFSSFYKLASFNVHASARSLFFNLASMGSSDVLLAGRSNAGLAEPGERTAHTLLYVTSLFVGNVGQNIERLAEMKSLLINRDKVGPALAKAERQLAKDERALAEPPSGKRAGNN